MSTLASSESTVLGRESGVVLDLTPSRRWAVPVNISPRMRRQKSEFFPSLTAATKVRTCCLKNFLQFPRYLKIHLSEIFDARIGDGEVCP